MSDHPTPRHYLALAEMLDHEAFVLKTTAGQHRCKVAAQLRRIADVLEGKV